jgi:hypothetical protein
MNYETLSIETLLDLLIKRSVEVYKVPPDIREKKEGEVGEIRQTILNKFYGTEKHKGIVDWDEKVWEPIKKDY